MAKKNSDHLRAKLDALLIGRKVGPQKEPAVCGLSGFKKHQQVYDCL